jgi:hypothetical protein
MLKRNKKNWSRYRFALLAVFLPFVSFCGRYADPYNPEQLEPRAVEASLIIAQEAGVELKWRAPEKDRRGKDLKSLAGFRVLKKEVLEKGDLYDQDKPFNEIAYVKDRSVAEREKLRREARAERKPGRLIKAPSELREHTFIDKKVLKGRSYAYQIKPVYLDSEEVEQAVVDSKFQTLIVLYRGSSSNTAIIPPDAGGEEQQDKIRSLYAR